MATSTISLPGGRWQDHVRYRDVELRPLSARDHVQLADPGGPAAGSTPASLLTWLLARCIVRLGPIGPVDEGAIRELSVGDREALALHLRRGLAGEAMPCVVACPSCLEQLDVELSVDGLLVPPYDDARPWYEAFEDLGGAAWRVRFRLPTGRDQEEAGAGSASPRDVAAVILRRCVLGVWRDGEAVDDGLPESLAARLPRLMADLDPQAMVLLDMRCPACAERFAVPFSPSAYLAGELIERSERLIGEVHALAMGYHWSEAAILALPEHRRRAYLQLLDGSAPAVA